MAVPRKKQKGKANDVSKEADDEKMVLSDEDDDFINTNINVDFEARNAEHFDYHGIRKLLHQLLLKANVDISEIANDIIEHNYIGSVIKQVPPSTDEDEDDDDDDDDGAGEVFGIITAMNLSTSSKVKAMEQLREMLISRCSGNKKSNKISSSLTSLLEDRERKVGLIINERFINLPPQIALPSFQALWKELETARKRRPDLQFSDYVMVCKTYKSSDGQMRGFVNAEEEIFSDNADLTFEYSVKSERDTGIGDQWDSTDDELEPIRTVVIFSANKISVIVQKMTELLS